MEPGQTYKSNNLNMKLSIIAILLSISAMCFGQADSLQLDTIPITAPTHLQALPELLKESQELQQAKAQIDQAMKNNSEKVMLILAAYVDPTKIKGITEDRKSIIAEK